MLPAAACRGGANSQPNNNEHTICQKVTVRLFQGSVLKLFQNMSNATQKVARMR
jgi:hypothetical protein